MSQLLTAEPSVLQQCSRAAESSWWWKMKINWKKMKKENGFQRFLSETDLLYNNRSFQRDNIQFYFLGFKVKRTTTLQLWPSYSNSIIAAIPSFLEEKNSSSSVFFTGENPKDQLDSIRHFEEFCRSSLPKPSKMQHQRKTASSTIHHSFTTCTCVCNF